MAMESTLGLEREHAYVELDGTSYEVVALSGRETFMRLFRYEITCAARAADETPRSMLGKRSVITLFGYGAEKRVHGIVTEAERTVSDDGKAILTVIIRPEAYLLTLGRNSRVFQDMTVIDIVRAVFSSNGQSIRWEVMDSYEPHVHCAQYREDDWTFVSRLLEEEGIYCWFDHGHDKTTLVFSDLSAAASDMPGGAHLVFAPESGTHADQEVVFEWGEYIAARTTKFTSRSFDPDRPRLKVEATEGNGPFEWYDAPGGGPESPEAVGRQVKNRLQAAIAASCCMLGKSTSVRLTPGMAIEMSGCPVARFDDRHVLTDVAIHIVQRRRGSAHGAGDKPVITTFSALRSVVPYRPVENTKVARQAGLQTGRVVGAKGADVQPDARGCVRVKLRWDRDERDDDTAGKWMRVAQRGTAESMLLPRIGWNVLTLNEEGSVDAPHVVSRIHDAEHPPTYSLPATKSRVVWKTATTPADGSSNEIYFEDKQGREEMFMNASHDMTVLTQHVKTDQVGHDQSRVIGNDHTMSVGLNHNENIGHDQTVSIGGNERSIVAKGCEKSVKGDESITIGGSRNMTTGGQHTTNVNRDRKLSVGSTLVDLTIGQISSSSRFSTVLVGGARVIVSGGAISEDVASVAIQTIGGAKIEIAGTNCPVDAKSSYVEMVGGTMILQAGGNYADTADEKSFWKVGAKLSAKAPQMFFEAKDRIEVTCGASSIVLTPDAVEIISPKYDLSGASLDIDTAVINHN